MNMLTKITLSPDTLKFLVSHVKCGIAIINKNGDFLMSNEYFSDMLGYSLTEMLYQNCINLSSVEYQQKNKEVMEEADKTGSYEGLIKECHSKYSGLIWVNMNITKLDNNQFLIVSNDISKERRLEQKVNEQTLELKSLLMTINKYMLEDNFDKVKFKNLIDKCTSDYEYTKAEIWR